jgi:hypothetical protein
MGPRPDPTMTGRCNLYRSVGSSKIKIRISSWHKAKLALCHGEVRILIFDYRAEQETSQCPEFCSAQLNSTRVLILSREVDGAWSMALSLTKLALAMWNVRRIVRPQPRIAPAHGRALGKLPLALLQVRLASKMRRSKMRPSNFVNRPLSSSIQVAWVVFSLAIAHSEGAGHQGARQATWPLAQSRWMGTSGPPIERRREAQRSTGR